MKDKHTTLKGLNINTLKVQLFSAVIFISLRYELLVELGDFEFWWQNINKKEMNSISYIDSLPWINRNPGLTEIHLNKSQLAEKVDDPTPQPVVFPENLAARIVTLTYSYPQIDFLLEKDGVGCIAAGDIAVLKGKAKAGKTTAMLCLISALLKGDYAGFKSLKKDANVLFIDTEQNPLNTAILTRKVHSLCGFATTEDHPRFRALNLRGDTPAERCELILEAVKYFTPDLLVIDGAKDLILGTDINDPKASGQAVQILMTLTKIHNVAIITTLHENKGDQNLRGHIGTELLNKCAECWQVRKYDDIFEIEQTECRNQSVTGFSFTFDQNKLPAPIEHTPKTVASTANQRIKEAFAQCLPAGSGLRYTDLKNKYIEIAACSETSAETHISKALKYQYLIKNENGYYSLKSP